MVELAAPPRRTVGAVMFKVRIPGEILALVYQDGHDDADGVALPRWGCGLGSTSSQYVRNIKHLIFSNGGRNL